MSDVERVAAIMRETAQRVILPRFRALDPGQVKMKTGPMDLVTVADVESEEMLSDLLRAAFPGSVVLGEEEAARDPSVLRRLDGAAPVWILDPIDGTYNFAHGRPGFGTIVSYVESGVVQAGWIHDPLADVTVWARRSVGAWCGDRRLVVDAAPALPAMTGSAYGTRADGAGHHALLAGSGRCGRLDNRMCGAVEYMALADGTAHFAVYEHSLPWDHAAGVLIAQEAGGTAAFLDGSPYDVRITDRPVLVAATDDAWKELQTLLDAAPLP